MKFGMGPIGPIRQRLMLREGLDNLCLSRESRTSDISIEPDDSETVVHTSNEEVLFSFLRGMPLHAPSTTSYIHIHEWDKWLSHVK